MVSIVDSASSSENCAEAPNIPTGSDSPPPAGAAKR